MAVDRPRTIYRRQELHTPFSGDTLFPLPILPGATVRIGTSFVVKRNDFDAVQVTYAFCYTTAGADAHVRADAPEPAAGAPYDIWTFGRDAAKRIGARCSRFGRGGRPIDPI